MDVVVSRPGTDVVFDWRLSRRHGELTSLITGFRGLLHSDGFAAYRSRAKQCNGVGARTPQRPNPLEAN